MRDNIIWRKIAADCKSSKRKYDRSSQIRRPCCRPYRDPTAPPVSPRRDPAAPSMSTPLDSTVPPVFPPRDPVAPLVSPLRDPTAPPISPPSGSVAASCVPSSRFGSASCVPSLGSDGAVSPVCVFVVPAAAPAPAPARRAEEPLFLQSVYLCPALCRGPYRQHHRCRSCQAFRSSAWPVVSLSSASAPRRALTALPSLFSSPQRFSLPSPLPLLDSHLLRKAIPCKGRS